MVDHSMMDHSKMDHGNMSMMSTPGMDHSGMDDSGMDHSKMDHSGMDDMGGMYHSDMDAGSLVAMHMMKMYFHFSVDSTILFSFWKTTSWQGMFGSCVAVFVMAMLYEGLKVGRELLLKHSLTNEHMAVPSSDVLVIQPARSYRTMLISRSHLLQSLLHIIQIVISYFLMLIFMTFNMWLCISVALGAGVGYFLFAWKRTMIGDANEHCH